LDRRAEVLGWRCGIGDLLLDQHRVAALLIDGRFVVHVASDPERDTPVLYVLLERVLRMARYGL
jgi:hypothetical protein